MKKKIQKSSIAFLFFGLFMFSFAQDTQAQITVYNFTSCWVYFEANEGAGCNPCSGAGGWIAPGGGNLLVPNACSTPQNWIYVKYGTAPFPAFSLIGQAGVTWRPGSFCGVDQGTDCNGNQTNHQWSVDPITGEARVAIF